MSKYYLLVVAAVVSLGAIQLVSCFKTPNALQSLTSRTWHQKFGWKPEKYFSDEKVIALCRAIEANDLKEIDRSVAAGADVNAKGEGNMTPLLWAFPDNKPERFKRLLEHGADPNVIVSSDFNTPHGGIAPGDSVTYMAAKTWFPEHFKHVLAHGGDPNLDHPSLKETPLFTVIRGTCSNKKERIQLLIDAGADLNDTNWGATPAMQAVGWFGQYDIALQLLKAGADYRIYQSNQNSRLIHVVVRDQRRLKIASDQQKRNYVELVSWLAAHGESVEDAQKDLARWASRLKAGSAKTIGELRRAEIAEREARVKAEQKNEQPEG